MRILSLYFHPDIATTGQLLTDLAVGLTEKGFSVRVITAQPTYEKNTVARSENYRGVDIVRLWSTQFNKNTFLGKVVNSISFFLSALVSVLVSEDRSPLLIVSNPPFLPLIGVISNFFQGTRFIFLVHDVYPDIAVRLQYLKQGGVIHTIWNSVNKLILKRASSIIVLSSTMKKQIERKYNFSMHARDARPPIDVIHNWADGEYIKPMPKDTNVFLQSVGLESKFVVQYSGNHGLFHKLETIVLSAGKCNDRDIVFLFIGDGGKKQTLMQMTRERKLDNVVFLPYQKYDVLPQSVTAASVAIVTLEENIEGLAMPSKLYSILASGTPVIALCDADSSVADIIRAAHCGYVISQGDVDGLLRVILSLKSDRAMLATFAANARQYFEDNFAYPIALERYSSVIERIL
ncbi:MAG: glycosyltransferase family 4 protein [Ignavibacteriales bacterium]|nr:glycosyltransferase family 4 protein [Ignavibacteriales bacterium]